MAAADSALPETASDVRRRCREAAASMAAAPPGAIGLTDGGCAAVRFLALIPRGSAFARVSGQLRFAVFAARFRLFIFAAKNNKKGLDNLGYPRYNDIRCGRLAQLVAHPLDVREVTSSSLVSSTKKTLKPQWFRGFLLFLRRFSSSKKRMMWEGQQKGQQIGRF